MDKRKAKIAAAIDIGSSMVRMQVSQWDGRGIVPLDQLERPINMGQEVFSAGYISYDTVNSLSEILDGFCAVAMEYEVARPHAMATTALREAANRAYVIDHIAIRNRLDIHVLEDIEANALLFDAMKNRGYPAGEEVMLVYGGTGTIDFALHQGGQTVIANSIPTGLLKIAEMLRETSDYSTHIDIVAEEYLHTFLTRAGRVQDLTPVKGMIFGSGDMQPLLKLCGSFGKLGADNVAMLQASTLLELYEQYRSLSVDQISARHKIGVSQGGILFAALTLLSSIIKITKVKKIFCAQTELTDAALDLLLRPGARRAYNESLREGAVSSAFDLAKRYRCDLEHARHVSDLALTLFEELRRLHGLSRKQSLLLRTACILHEAGHYTNTADQQEASYDLIKDAQIYGLKSHETLLAANIIAPRNLLGITRGEWRGALLEEDEILFVGKMHALLHLADALDYSRRQKARICGVEQDGNKLTLSLKVREDYALEQWMFRQSALLFQEVFGVVPQLRIENTYGIGGSL